MTLAVVTSAFTVSKLCLMSAWQEVGGNLIGEDGLVVKAGVELEWYQIHQTHSICSVLAIVTSCPPLSSLLWSAHPVNDRLWKMLPNCLQSCLTHTYIRHRGIKVSQTRLTKTLFSKQFYYFQHELLHSKILNQKMNRLNTKSINIIQSLRILRQLPCSLFHKYCSFFLAYCLNQ